MSTTTRVVLLGSLSIDRPGGSRPSEPSPDTEAVLRRALGRRIAQSPAAVPEPDPAAARDEPAPADAAGPFAHLSVLVVEDHPFQRRTALALLRGLGVGTLADARAGDGARNPREFLLAATACVAAPVALSGNDSDGAARSTGRRNGGLDLTGTSTTMRASARSTGRVGT
ncbi:MAG TPA: hypothetical protein VNA28_15245 [Solirubrobacteraceae bacterium]|nr:hypothetical protein [Solirubrobacteraceae bacterium]